MRKLLLLSLIIGSLYAQKVEYQLSLVGMSMDYREYDRAGVILDSEASEFSDISGAEVSYRFYLNDENCFEAAFLGISGETKYVGAYIGSGLPYGSVVSTTQNTIYDVSFGYHGKKELQKGFALLGGLSLGYRFWERELSVTQIEDYYWLSLRANAGVGYSYKNFSIAVKGEYQYGIDPQMSASGFSEDFQLASANIIKATVPIQYSITDHIALSCEYVYEYQKIEESNIVFDARGNGYLEPDSNAYNQYVKFGVILKY